LIDPDPKAKNEIKPIMRSFLFVLALLVASCSAFTAPVAARGASKVQMSLGRREAAMAVVGGFAAIVAGANKAEAKEKKPTPTFAEVRA
jgi:hypothetical protein